MSLSGQGPRSPASCTEQVGHELHLQSAKSYARGRDLATIGILKAHRHLPGTVCLRPSCFLAEGRDTGCFAQDRQLRVIKKEEGRRGSPDIPEIHPLPNPPFFAHASDPAVSGPGKRGDLSPLLSVVPHLTGTLRSHPRGSLAGKPCARDDITDQPFLSTSIAFYSHSLEAHCRTSQRLEQAGI